VPPKGAPNVLLIMTDDQGYGVSGTFVDAVAGAVTFAEQLEQVIEEVTRDATALGCLAEVQHCRTIAGSGTSADKQLAVYAEANGKSEETGAALRAVTNWIAQATLQ